MFAIVCLNLPFVSAVGSSKLYSVPPSQMATVVDVDVVEVEDVLDVVRVVDVVDVVDDDDVLVLVLVLVAVLCKRKTKTQTRRRRHNTKRLATAPRQHPEGAFLNKVGCV